MATPDRGPRIFPQWLSSWQSRYVNPTVRRVAPYLPTFAVIAHRGRKSGKEYATPVNATSSHGTFVVVLGHGITDWARNVIAAGETTARYNYRTIRITNPRIVQPGEAGAELPRVARMANGRVALFVADVAAD